MNQCGVMRAIGMEGKQLLHMVRAEAVVYALFGAAAGILMGLPAHRFVYEQLVTSRWGDRMAGTIRTAYGDCGSYCCDHTAGSKKAGPKDKGDGYCGYHSCTVSRAKKKDY